MIITRDIVAYVTKKVEYIFWLIMRFQAQIITYVILNFWFPTKKEIKFEVLVLQGQKSTWMFAFSPTFGYCRRGRTEINFWGVPFRRKMKLPFEACPRELRVNSSGRPSSVVGRMLYCWKCCKSCSRSRGGAAVNGILSLTLSKRPDMILQQVLIWGGRSVSSHLFYKKYQFWEGGRRSVSRHIRSYSK